MTLPFAVQVRGLPQPKGSKRAFVIEGQNRAVVVDTNKLTMRTWERLVQWVAQEHWEGPAASGPLAVTLEFIFTRPASMSKRRPKQWVDVRPDLSKLTRLVEDALIGIVYRDDAQIAHEHLSKRYGDEPGVHIFIDALAPVEVGKELSNVSR